MRTRFGALAMVLILLCTFGVPSAVAQEPVTISCLINHTWYPVHSFDGLIPQEMTRQSGVTLDVTVVKNERQLNQMVATGNLPDIVYSSTQLDRLSDPKLCYSYDELLEKYDIDWEIPADLRANAMIFSSDEHIYTLLNNYASDEDWQHTRSVPMTASLMVRQDILDALGVERIATLDELRDIFLRVRDAHPDMVPLTFDAVHRFNIFRCYFGFGLLPFLEQTDGTQLYYARDARYRAMLLWLNDLYREGCMTVDNFASVNLDSGVLYDKGQAFAFTACTQNANLSAVSSLRALNSAWKSVELYPLEGSNYDTQGAGWSGVFITKNARDPEACIRFVAWCFTPEAQRLTEWGRENIDYVLGENGLPVFSADVQQSIIDNTYTMRYQPWFYFGTSAIVESEGRCALQGVDISQETYDAIRGLYHIKPWITAALPKSGTELAATYEYIQSMMDSYETKILLSADDEAFERNYQEMMDYLDAMHIEDIEAYLTERIPEEYARYQQRAEEAGKD